jgi:hypothetical protein
MSTPHALPRQDGQQPSRFPVRWSQAMPRANRYLTLALYATLIALLVQVLFESWVQELFAHRTVDAAGVPVGDLPSWPKTVKNGLLVLLVLMSLTKVAIERRWRDFTTRADIALAGLVIIMVVAGLVGTSGPVLIGQALFVYLRGAIVFYAVRALQPTWEQVKRGLWIVGAVVGLNIIVAVFQMILDQPAFSGIGLVDRTWADLHRATGLLDHPNHLGHVLGLVLIGLFAWMSGLPRLARERGSGADGARIAGRLAALLPPAQQRRWWLALGAVALGLAASQSRESMLAALAAAAVIWFLRRGGGRRLLVAGTVIVVLFAGNTLLRPGNLEQLVYRVGGFFHAVQTPSGAEKERCEEFETLQECIDAQAVQAREVRVLFYQQGARLLAHRPLLGYGVGQFGGIVAEQHDPNWENDPRFPGGFDLYGFEGITVDSFWLHLAVETGILGLLAYLAWLWLLVVPLIGVTRRYVGRKVWGATSPRGPTDERAQAVALWGIGAMVFTVIVATLSPSLEDPLYPPLLFAVFGLAWVLTRDVRHDADRKPGPARRDGLGS